MARAIFCVAAAVAAAALIDPAVEWMANRGLFGRGAFTDHSNLDVAPALIAAALFALVVLFGLVRRTMNREGRYAPDWLRAYEFVVTPRSVSKLVPAIFALQLLVLWSMETLEQIAVDRHPLGGTIWLGGPVAISLLFHAAGCLALTWLLSRTLHWSAKTIADVITYVRQLQDESTSTPAPPCSRAFEWDAVRFLEPILARLSGRAPPSLHA